MPNRLVVPAQEFESVQAAVDYVSENGGGVVEVSGHRPDQDVQLRRGVILKGTTPGTRIGRLSWYPSDGPGLDPGPVFENLRIGGNRPGETVSQRLAREFLAR